MIRIFFFSLLLLICYSNSIAQTYTWSGYTAGSMSYTTGIMTATVTSSAAGFQYGSPKYYSGSTVGSGFCGIAGGLALEQMFGNITSAYVNLAIDFTSGNTTNGTCASISFQIKDINADESVQTFRDFIHISATDGTNTAIPVANITTSGGSNKTITTSGGTTRIIAGSSGSYGSRSQTACDVMTITITPPAGTTLKRINIRWQPSYETCANCYYNWTGPNRPAYQYISIGSLTGTATGGCTVLPVEITSFKGKCEDETKKLEWTTATETDNQYFWIEGSKDANEFMPLAKIDGAGNSSIAKEYSWIVKDDSEQIKYFRLKQEDSNGEYRYSEIITLNCADEWDLTLYPNPANQTLFISGNNLYEVSRIEIYDLTGRIVMQENFTESDQSFWELNISELSAAYYTIGWVDHENNLVKTMPLVKE